MIRYKSPQLLFFLLLLGQVNCSDCTEKKPTPSQQSQPTPIQGLPDIPIVPPADESPATSQSPEKTISDTPEKPTPPDENPTEKLSSLIITFSDENAYINLNLRSISAVFKRNNISRLSINGIWRQFERPLPSPKNNNLKYVYEGELPEVEDILRSKKLLNPNNQVVISIPRSESSKLKDLKMMFLGNSIIRIEFLSFERLSPTCTNSFVMCDNLIHLILPEIDYSNLQDCAYMFKDCYKLTLERTNLTEQDISAFDNRLSQLDTDSKMSAFYGCPLGNYFSFK